MTDTDLQKEFDRQVGNLIHRNYPHVEKIKSLKTQLEGLSLPDLDLQKGTLPFVIVVKSNVISAEKQMTRVEKNEKNGVTILRPHTSQNFKVIEGVNLPSEDFYLLIDVDRGKDNINLPPNEAFKIIERQNRSPLTIDEGIAIVTHFPEFLIKNNCYSLLASRTG